MIRGGLAALLLIASSSVTLAQSNVEQTIRYGEIVTMERTTVVEKSTGSGAKAGATVGAVAGYALADGRDRWLGALVGGALGGAGGRAAERAGKKKKGFQLIIRLESGEEIGVQVVGKKLDYGVGDRVRLLDMQGKTQVSKVKG